MEPATGCVTEQRGCFREQAPVDAHAFRRKNNPIPSHRNDGLQERHSAVGARCAMSPVSALAGFRGEWLDGAKFDYAMRTWQFETMLSFDPYWSTICRISWVMR